jgi:acyl transferase domain-containing protein
MKIANSLENKFLTIPKIAYVFANLRFVLKAYSGVIHCVNAFAHQKSAQPTCTSEPISMTHHNAVASASHTSALLAITGTRIFVIASVHHPQVLMNALLTTNGTAKTADADVLLLTAVLNLKLMKKSTSMTLNSVNVNVWKTHRILARLINISIIKVALVFVHQIKIVNLVITGTPEFVDALKIIAYALLVNTGTTTRHLRVVHAFHKNAQPDSNGILKAALANATIWTVLT